MGLETALAIGGLAVSAVGTLASANAQAAGSEFNAAVSRNAALSARYQGEENERRIRRDALLRSGANSANRAASGVGATGSALDVMADSAAELELSALDARYQGQVQSDFYNQQASLDDFNASSARRGAVFSVASTVLGAGFQYGRSLLPKTAPTVGRFTRLATG